MNYLQNMIEKIENNNQHILIDLVQKINEIIDYLNKKEDNIEYIPEYKYIYKFSEPIERNDIWRYTLSQDSVTGRNCSKT